MARGALLLGLGLVGLGVVKGQAVVQCANWAGRFDEMNRVCCADQPGGACANGFPPECDQQCASIFAIFSDDCEGMLDLLGLATPEYVEFTAKCQESFVPRGIADCGTDGCESTGVRVQFDLDMTGVDVPSGASVQACGTFNNWCTPVPGRPRLQPLEVTQQAYPANGNQYRAQIMLPEGTYEYKYRILAPGAEEGDWEDVPEACGVQGPYGFNRVVTVVTGNVGLNQQTLGAGVTNSDVYSECGSQSSCAAMPQLDASFLGEVSDRTGDHEINLNGDAHAEADGMHFDGDGDFVSIPNFKYYDGARWAFSMWVATDVCDPNDPTPSVFGYIYSHTQLVGAAGSTLGTSENQNINVYQSCATARTAQLVDSSGYVRFLFVADAGFLSFDVTLDSIEQNLDEHAAFTQFAVTFNSDDVELYVNGVGVTPYQLTPSPITTIQAPAGFNNQNAFGMGPHGHGSTENLNGGQGIGKFHLNSDIYIGGRADEDADRFYTGSIAGLQIFTNGLTATDVSCIYQDQEVLITGTTAHSCTYHSEGYSWQNPMDVGAIDVGTLCTGAEPLPGAATGPTCSGSVDDGYIHFPLGDLHFPFMGRSENDLYISTNGYISFSGEQATDGGTTIIPLHGAKPDDAIFVYWTDLDFSFDPSGNEGSVGDDSGVFVATAPGELTVTWLNAPYFCGVQQGAPTIACTNPRATASFQVTLKQDGSIKMQYQSVDPFASPPWAPVSIGLEGVDGYDGLQVVYDDHNFPKAGTAIGFSTSCATAGENDCDVGDIARASASCLLFSVARPDCMTTYTFGQQPPADCAQAFCTSDCFGDAFNLNEDCVANPRANIDAQSRQTIMQLAPPQLLQACPQPDHGTALPGGGGH